MLFDSSGGNKPNNLSLLSTCGFVPRLHAASNAHVHLGDTSPSKPLLVMSACFFPLNLFLVQLVLFAMKEIRMLL